MLVIAIVVMASLVVVLRGQSPQPTVFPVSGFNNVESAYSVKFGDTILGDNLSTVTPWSIDYPKNTSSAHLSAGGVLTVNGTFSPSPAFQAVRLLRSVNLSLAQNPVFLVTLESSVGVSYGIRISGVDSLGRAFDAWSETSYLQHRPGLGRLENFTINAAVESLAVNGALSISGSRITSLVFYVEIGAGQARTFFLKLFHMEAVSLSQTPFEPTGQASGSMLGLVLNLNVPNATDYSDENFFQAYIQYLVSGTPNSTYAIYYMRGSFVVAQSSVYPTGGSGYQIAVLTRTLVNTYPPFLVRNATVSFAIATTTGYLHSFQMVDYSVRYLSQGYSIQQVDLYQPSLVLYYIGFLFVTPILMVILVSKLFSRDGR